MQLIARSVRQDTVDSKLQAGNLFRRYGEMKRYDVRQADVAGNEIERLRQRRDMLMSMDPERAKQVIEFTGRVNFFEALALAKKEDKLIVPNSFHDRILTETREYKYFRQNYLGVWTGTLIVYEKPDIPFGEQVVFQGITFIVPEQFRGKTNCALVVEYPDFELANNRDKIKVLGEQNVHKVEHFPRESGAYYYDETFRIPVGDKLETEKVDNTMRGLYRVDSNYYIGLLIRGSFDLGIRRQGVLAINGPFHAINVALF